MSKPLDPWQFFAEHSLWLADNYGKSPEGRAYRDKFDAHVIAARDTRQPDHFEPADEALIRGALLDMSKNVKKYSTETRNRAYAILQVLRMEIGGQTMTVKSPAQSVRCSTELKSITISEVSPASKRRNT